MPDRKNCSRGKTKQWVIGTGFGDIWFNMRWATIGLIVAGIQIFPRVCEFTGFTQSEITLSSNIIPAGDLALIKVGVMNGEIPQVTWMQKEIHLVPNSKKTMWHGFLGADLGAEPGSYKVLVKMRPSGHEKHMEIRIRKKDYGVRRLTLPKNMVDLDAQTLRRVKRESKIMKSLWVTVPSAPLWGGSFLRPVPGVVVGPFGRRSIINEQSRAPHSGVDLRAERGTPIKATNNGRVALTVDHFFSGRSVVIDHGGGILSTYFHLHKILVEYGEMVTKGQVIGLVGSTGRASGPHLHWGIRVNGARVDPLRLTELSRQLEE